MTKDQLKDPHADFDGGFKILKVTDTNGTPLSYIINKNMMRIDLPKTLKSGGVYSFTI